MGACLSPQTLAGAVVMAPMTKGSNLPYRQLCIELGARVLVSEMVVARRLKQRRRGEFALIRRAPGEPCFGVQLAGNRPDEMAWAAALVEARGADFVDLNRGCPIDHFTRMGLGAALARQPGRVRTHRRRDAHGRVGSGHREDPARLDGRQEELPRSGARPSLTAAPRRSPCTGARAKRATAIRPTGTRSAKSPKRAGAGDRQRRHAVRARDRARARVDGLHRGDDRARRARSSRGFFARPSSGYWDITAEERLAIYRRYVELATRALAAARRRRARRVRPDAAARVPALARRLLVPLRATAARRHVAVDAAARSGVRAADRRSRRCSRGRTTPRSTT